MSDHYDASTGRLLDEPDGIHTEGVENCAGCHIEYDEYDTGRKPRIVYCPDHLADDLRGERDALDAQAEDACTHYTIGRSAASAGLPVDWAYVAKQMAAALGLEGVTK